MKLCVRRLVCILLCALWLLTLCACGQTDSNTLSQASSESALATGTYVFVDQQRHTEHIYAIELKEDGGYTISVDGDTFTGSRVTVTSDGFQTGPMDGTERPSGSFFAADGSCTWVHTGDLSVEPENYIPLQPDQVYTYDETLLDGSRVVWTLDLYSDASFDLSYIDEDKPIGDLFTGRAWSQSDDGKLIRCTALDTVPESAINDWLKMDGFVVMIENDVFIPLQGDVQADTAAVPDYDSVPYASLSDAQVCDIYLPASATAPYPVIILLHGGGFATGTQKSEILRPVIEAATARGYAVVSADYRKSDEAIFPASVADTRAAVRFVRASADTYGLDPERIVLWGESAGAYLAIMAALTTGEPTLAESVPDHAGIDESVAALVDFYGPVQFATMQEECAALGIDADILSESSYESRYLGQSVAADEAMTAMSWWSVYASTLPEDFGLFAWIQHGDNDQVVPYTQSSNFARSLEKLVGPENIVFRLTEGAGHQDAAFYTQENLDAVLDFLDEALS